MAYHQYSVLAAEEVHQVKAREPRTCPLANRHPSVESAAVATILIAMVDKDHRPQQLAAVAVVEEPVEAEAEGVAVVASLTRMSGPTSSPTSANTSFFPLSTLCSPRSAAKSMRRRSQLRISVTQRKRVKCTLYGRKP